MATGKDSRVTHLNISLIKSAIRIAGCVLGIFADSVTVLALFFLLAEALEIVMERE